MVIKAVADFKEHLFRQEADREIIFEHILASL